MTKKLGLKTVEFLRACGYLDTFIERRKPTDRLVQDLGIDGDNLMDDLKVLQERFKVDMKDFRFELYSPTELSKDAFFFGLLPRWLATKGRQAKYRPITLELIERSIAQKRWADSIDA